MSGDLHLHQLLDPIPYLDRAEVLATISTVARNLADGLATVADLAGASDPRHVHLLAAATEWGRRATAAARLASLAEAREGLQ